jgi:hypothetical protein
LLDLFAAEHSACGAELFAFQHFSRGIVGVSVTPSKAAPVAVDRW